MNFPNITGKLVKIASGGNTHTGTVTDVTYNTDKGTIFIFDDLSTFTVPAGHALSIVPIVQEPTP